MAHDVIFNIPSRSLGKSDVEFQVKKDGATLGTLKVSKGSVVWFPANTTYGYKVNWSKFDSILKENGTETERR